MATRKLVYDVGDRPKLKSLFAYSFQLLLSILAATVAVPTAIGMPSHIPSAILGAGVGTLIYIFFTKGKSPVILSSSFSFIAALPVALAYGYMGVLLGSIFAGLIYIIIGLIVKFAGTKLINRFMPAVIIGPVVTLIGLSLAPHAINDLTAANSSDPFASYNFIAILCGLVTLFVIVICTVQNRFREIKLIPFIIGIGAGYLLANIFTAIGNATNVSYLKVVNWDSLVKSFSPVTINSFFSVPRVSLIEGIKEIIHGTPSTTYILDRANYYFALYPHWFTGVEISEANVMALKDILISHEVFYGSINGIGVAAIAVSFCPIALVSFAEHLADHKNLSVIIGRDLINDEPGLHRTLLGDGFGTITGTAFGICPNTSYGESIACVALTRNASVVTTFMTACICIVLSFLSPVAILFQTIPRCVMGGVCLALYGYISVSGLKMIKEVELDDNANLLTICVILISGVGGFTIQIPYVINEDPSKCSYIAIGAIATAMLLGITINQIAQRIYHREKGLVVDVTDIKEVDYVRIYLKRFSSNDLTKAMKMFGFVHESVELTTAQLSNFLHSQEILNLRSVQELKTLIKILKFEGKTDGLNKTKLIALIKKNCEKIDTNLTNPYLFK